MIGVVRTSGCPGTVVKMKRARLLLLPAMFLLAVGCAAKGPPVPTYPRASAAESLEMMRERAAGFAGAAGKGSLVIEREKGSVGLDAAFVAAPPGRARVRAWKFSQAVLDVTAKQGKVWLFRAQPPPPKRASAPLGIVSTGAAHFGNERQIGPMVEALMPLLAGDVDPNGSASAAVDGPTLRVVRFLKIGGSEVILTGEIDRDTLTARRWVVRDGTGRERAQLDLSDYRPVGGGVWPWRVRATLTGVAGVRAVEFRAKDVSPFVAPAEGEPDPFQPPRRASLLGEGEGKANVQHRTSNVQRRSEERRRGV